MSNPEPGAGLLAEPTATEQTLLCRLRAEGLKLRRRRKDSQWVALVQRMRGLTRELFPDIPEGELEWRVVSCLLLLRKDRWEVETPTIQTGEVGK
jgi:hypothetical protein